MNTWESSIGAWQSFTTARLSVYSSASKTHPASCSARCWRGWLLLSLRWQVRSYSLWWLSQCWLQCFVLFLSDEGWIGKTVFLFKASFDNSSCCLSTGQNSSTAKLKSLTGAIEIMTETRHAFQLIHKELQEEQTEVSFTVAHGGFFLAQGCDLCT